MTRETGAPVRSAAVLAALVCAGITAIAAAWIVFRTRPPKTAAGIFLPAPANMAAVLTADHQALEHDPDDLKAMTDLGLLYYLKGSGFYAQAINYLEQAREMGALDARIFYCLGAMYQALGLYPFAIENDQRYLRNVPGDEPAALVTAKLLYQSGRFSEAIEEYQKIEPMDPRNPILIENLALSLWKNKEQQEALNELDRLSALGPQAAARAAVDRESILAEPGRRKKSGA